MCPTQSKDVQDRQSSDQKVPSGFMARKSRIRSSSVHIQEPGIGAGGVFPIPKLHAEANRHAVPTPQLGEQETLDEA